MQVKCLLKRTPQSTESKRKILQVELSEIKNLQKNPLIAKMTVGSENNGKQ